MANSYSISHRTQKWIKNPFFFHVAILNSSCGGKKTSHTDFLFALVRNMLARAGQEQIAPRPLSRPPTTAAQVSRPEFSRSKHWPTPPVMQLRYFVCG
jgi:hypothetical protein